MSENPCYVELNGERGTTSDNLFLFRGCERRVAQPEVPRHKPRVMATEPRDATLRLSLRSLNDPTVGTSQGLGDEITRRV